jgi:prolyl-tRNA synthetase
MKKNFIIIFACLSVLQGIAQKRFEIKGFGFSMDAPKDWIEMKNDEVLKNLDKYDLTEEQLEELLASNNSAASLATYTKYNPKKYAGIIPTIKINTRETDSKTIESFRKAVESSTKEGMKTLENFRFTENPTAVKISNKDALKFTVQFTMRNGDKQYEIVSHSYYILLKGYFISLNFIEQAGKEDNGKLFDEVFQSIQIAK